MEVEFNDATRHKSLSEFDPTPSTDMHYVYVLKNIATGELYYGYTNKIKRRIAEHNRKRRHELIYYEAYKTAADAHNREKRLKQHAQALTALKSRLKESLK